MFVGPIIGSRAQPNRAVAWDVKSPPPSPVGRAEFVRQGLRSAGAGG